MDNEWILFVYPFALIAYLMLAARWQPKASPAKPRDGSLRREQR